MAAGGAANLQQGSWDGFYLHLGVCAGSWAGLSALGFLLGSCRLLHRLEKFLRPLARVLLGNPMWIAFCGLLSLGTCGLYVMRGDDLEPFVVLDLAAQFVHAFEVAVLWLHASARSASDLLLLARRRLVVDMLILPSTLMWDLGLDREASFSYMASLRLVVLWHQLLESRPGHAQLRALYRGVCLLCGIFCAAMLLRQVEKIQGPAPSPSGPRGLWTLDSSAYFVVGCVLTVGYGDLAPRSYLGQALSAAVLLQGFWLLLRTSLGVMQAVDSARGGSGKYDSLGSTRHVVVTGTPSFEVLRGFLLELYNEDVRSENEDLHTVILLLPGQRPVVDQLRHLLKQASTRRFASFIHIVQGSALRHEDLKRVAYKDAVMAFLLPNVFAEDHEREDMDNMMRALSMQGCQPYVRLVALLLKEQNRDLMLAVGLKHGDILCADEVKHGFLAKSCAAQGFITLACSLFKRNGAVALESRAFLLKWLVDYTLALRTELFEEALSVAYKGAPFGEVALDILFRSEGTVYLVGLVEEPFYSGDETATLIFPGKQHKVGQSEDRLVKGLFVARARADIQQYPGTAVFPWQVDPEMRKSAAAQGREVVTLPGAVPEAMASEASEGWILQPKAAKSAKAARLLLRSRVAAAQWAAQGLKQETALEQESIDKIIGLEVGSTPSKEDGTNQRETALMQQQMMEEREAAAASEAAVEAKFMRRAKKFVAIAEELEDRRRQKMEPSEEEQEIDDRLWGYAQPEDATLRYEPPSAVLVRGGHVLLAALEGSLGASDSPASRLGRHLGLRHFLRSIRSKRRARQFSVVVVSEWTPRDWTEVAEEDSVWLVLGDPLQASTLRRAGLVEAHSVVIHQRNSSASMDPSDWDADAIFAIRLIEKMAEDAGRELPLICDLNFECNTPFVPYGSQWYELPGHADDDDDVARRLPQEVKASSFMDQPRFQSGHLFVSSIFPAMLANMFYKRFLGNTLRELICKDFVVAPLPKDFKGKTYGDLFEHILRKDNLLPMALLRRKDHEDEDDEDEEEDIKQMVFRNPDDDKSSGPERWSASEPPSERYIKLFPSAETKVADRDGVLCAVATAGLVNLPSTLTTPTVRKQDS